MLQDRNLQIENSWLGTWVRRRQFYIRYYRARTRWSILRRLEPILTNHFKNCKENDKNDWIAGVAVRLRAFPGWEDREFLIRWPGDKLLLRLRFFPWREEGCRANWSSPVTVLVFKKGKDGGQPVVVRFMSLFIEDDMIHVTQLQGMSKIEMPPGLKDWAERMLRACMQFAQQENLLGVSVAQAQSQFSFHHPYVHAWLSPDARQREADRIRDRMQAHHDGTARALGWVLDDAWFKWNNPHYRSRGRSRRLQRPDRHDPKCRHADTAR